MDKKDIKKDIEEIFQRTIELEKEVQNDNFSKIKLDYIKNSIKEIEEEINSRNYAVAEKNKEKNEGFNQEKIELLKEILEREEQEQKTIEKEKTYFEEKNRKEKKERQKSALEVYIIENIKLLIFSAFIMIGLVWLFVYVTNLTNYSEELRILTGFSISIGLLIYERYDYRKKNKLKIQSEENNNKEKTFKNKKSLIFILTGYVVGLLVLLFGTISLEVIHKNIAIIISLIYIGYGISQTRRLKTTIYDISIISTSLLLTFAYKYVEAPEYILYGYITLILISMTIVLKNQERKTSDNILIIGTLFITNVIGLIYEFKIKDVVNSDSFLLEELLSSLTTQVNIMMPIAILLISSISFLYLKDQGKNKLIISALYVSFFSQIIRINNVLSIEGTATLKIMNITLLIVMLITYLLAKKEKEKDLILFGKSTALITVMYVVTNYKNELGAEITLLLSIITLIVISTIAIKERLFTLRIVTVINYILIFANLITNNIEEGHELILIVTSILFAALSYLNVKKLNEDYQKETIENVKTILTVVNKIEILVKTTLMSIAVTNVFIRAFENMDVHYSWTIIPTTILVAIMFYQSKKEKQYEILVYGIGYLVFQMAQMMIFMDGQEYVDSNFELHSIVIMIFTIMTILFRKIIKTEETENEIYKIATRYTKKTYLYISTILSIVMITMLIEEIDGLNNMNYSLSALIAVIIGLITSFYAIKEKDVIMKTISGYQQLSSVYLVIKTVSSNLAVEGISIVEILSVILAVFSTVIVAKNANKNISKENEKWLNIVTKIYTQLNILAFLILMDGLIKNIILKENNLWVIETILLSILLLSIGYIFKNEQNKATSVIKYLYSFRIILVMTFEITKHNLLLENLLTNVIAPIILLIVLIKVYRENKNLGRSWMNTVLITYFYATFKVLQTYTTLIEDIFENTFMLFGIEKIFVIILMILFMYREKSKELLSPTKIFVELSYIVIFISFLLNVENISSFAITTKIIELIGMVFFIISILAIIKDYKEIDIRLLHNKLNERTIYLITIPVSLISIWMITKTFTYITNLGYNIQDNMVVGISIMYLIYEVTRIEKIKPTLKKTIIVTYLAIATYLYILVFHILAETEFIIRAIVFILIGIYGLYSVMKKPEKKEEK